MRKVKPYERAARVGCYDFWLNRAVNKAQTYFVTANPWMSGVECEFFDERFSGIGL